MDSIDASAMIAALRRVGLPENMLEINQTIYSGNTFGARDCGQVSGNLQEYSLSPFHFVMLMTVLMDNKINKLPGKDNELMQSGNITKLLYADASLLVSVSVGSLGTFTVAVNQIGSEYGLQIHMAD